MAVRRLPPESQIEVLHVGSAGWRREKSASGSYENPRYRWVGELPYWMTREVMARSHLAVITSRMEGSSNVFSEALASSVPVLASGFRA